MYGCESWTIKKTEHQRTDELLSFWTEVLEKTLESPLDSNEIWLVHPKRNQSWTFIGRTDVEAETPILWPPDAKNWFIWKDPFAGKDWRQEEKGIRWLDGISDSTWVGMSSRSSWCTGKPGVLQSMGLQRVRHDWANELNWTLFHYRYQALLSIIPCALHITGFPFSFFLFLKPDSWEHELFLVMYALYGFFWEFLPDSSFPVLCIAFSLDFVCLSICLLFAFCFVCFYVFTHQYSAEDLLGFSAYFLCSSLAFFPIKSSCLTLLNVPAPLSELKEMVGLHLGLFFSALRK